MTAATAAKDAQAATAATDVLGGDDGDVHGGGWMSENGNRAEQPADCDDADGDGGGGDDDDGNDVGDDVSATTVMFTCGEPYQDSTCSETLWRPAPRAH